MDAYDPPPSHTVLKVAQHQHRQRVGGTLTIDYPDGFKKFLEPNKYDLSFLVCLLYKYMYNVQLYIYCIVYSIVYSQWAYQWSNHCYVTCAVQNNVL